MQLVPAVDLCSILGPRVWPMLFRVAIAIHMELKIHQEQDNIGVILGFPENFDTQMLSMNDL